MLRLYGFTKEDGILVYRSVLLFSVYQKFFGGRDQIIGQRINAAFISEKNICISISGSNGLLFKGTLQADHSRENKMDPRTLLRLGEKGGKCGRKKPPIEALI